MIDIHYRNRIQGTYTMLKIQHSTIPMLGISIISFIGVVEEPLQRIIKKLKLQA